MGFEGEWDTCRLDEAATVERGKFTARPRNQPRFFGGETPFVQTGEVVSAARRLRRFSQTLNEEGLAVSKVFPENTILITIAANIGDLAITDFRVACPDSVVAIRAGDDFDTEFLYDFLGTKKVDLEAQATTNAQANINLQILDPLEVFAPTLPEQTQIGAYFQSLDRMIGLHQRKHDKLVTLKQAMLQKMFPQDGATTPEIRFKGFDQRWQRYGLGDITSKIGSGKTPKGGKSVYISNGIPLLRSQNIVNDFVDLDGIVFISDEIDEDMINSRVLRDDVLLNITGASIGRSAVYRTSEPANVNQHVCIIRADEYDSDFIQLNLTSSRGQRAIDNSQAGGGREGLNFQQIGRISFLFPSLSEQTQIGNYFRKLGKLTSKHATQLDKLKNIKSACLEKMFV